MNDTNHNFDLAFPLKISRYEYPATTKQTEATKDILHHYDEALQCFINKYHDSGRKILLVTDEFITAKTYNFKGKLEETDIDRGCIFSGKEGAGLQNIIGYAVGKLNPNTKLKEIALFNWQFGDFTFPLNKKSNENIKKLNIANEQFYDRLMDFIGEYRPDAVFIAGVLVWEYVNSRMQNDNQTNQRMLMGRIFRGRVPIKTTGWRLKLNLRKQQTNYHHFQLMGSVDCKRLCAWDASPTKHPNLIGYFSSCLRQLINGRNDYYLKIPKDVQFKLINTREKFDRLMRVIWKQRIVSIDTETYGLGRIKNTIYTIQFCYDGIIGYTIPIDHPYTPFNAKERQHIKNELQRYFEYGRSLYHIYQNGKFDIPVLFACCGVRFYNHRVYDIQSGEFSSDENVKLLQLWNDKSDKKKKSSPYALDFIAERYGCSIYRNIEFSKGSRGSIGKEPLTKRFVEYCGYDVIVPFHIHMLQIQEAKKRKHRKFLKFVCEQLSDTILTCAQMEHTGALIDKRALFELKARDGALAQETQTILNKFKKSEACQKVNNYLMKKEGIPQGGGIFGKQTWLFDINKSEHKQLLFFNALQLTPLAEMKLGGGKINKVFKKTYKDVEEVAIFNEYEALKHFTKGFVNPLFNKITTNEDSLFDGRLRSEYDYIYVSSGRLSSRKPNLQNIPARGNLAKKVKRIFIAKQGNMIVEADFAANEVRELANEAGDNVLAESFYKGLEYRVNFRILAYKYAKNIEEWLDVAKASKWSEKDEKTGKPIHDYDSKVAILENIQNKITRQIGYVILDIETKGDVHRLNCVTGDTLVATNKGLIQINNLVKTEKPPTILDNCVVGGRYRPSKATHAIFSGVKQTIQIETQKGHLLKQTNDHELLVFDHNKGKPDWKKANDCQKGDLLCINPDQITSKNKLKLKLIVPGNVNNSKRPPKPIQKPEYMTPSLAFFIACLIAEGNTYSKPTGQHYVEFVNSNKILIEKFENVLSNLFYTEYNTRIKIKKGTKTPYGIVTDDIFSVTIGSRLLISYLQQMGCYIEHGRIDGKTPSYRKIVPWSILQAGKQSQLAFLAGYLECDGTTTEGLLRWHSVNINLLRQIQLILNSHGYSPVIMKSKLTCKTLLLTGLQANNLWQDMKKYMVYKTFIPKCSSAFDGVPLLFWKNLIRKRRIGVGKYLNDQNEIVKPKRPSKGWNITEKQQFLPYSCSSKEIDNFFTMLKYISLNAYKNLKECLKHKYYYNQITNIKQNGKQKVYDLSVDRNCDPSFIANGHVIHNCVRFFGVDVLGVTDEQRYDIKSVVFGIIYQKGATGLAKPKTELGLGKSEEYCQGLIDTFYSEFKISGDYIKATNALGRANYQVESPLGMIRHLPAYLHSRPAMQNAMDRRTVNSIIQGVASSIGVCGCRNLQKLIWHFFIKQGANLDWRMLTNYVHDAVKGECKISFIPVYLYLLEHSATSLVHERYSKVFDYRLRIGLEMDYGLGASQDRVKSWDFTHKTLLDKIREEMEWQNKELGYNNNIQKEMKKVKHNWEIIKNLRLKELIESVKSKEPTKTMLMNEKNSMKMGLII